MTALTLVLIGDGTRLRVAADAGAEVLDAERVVVPPGNVPCLSFTMVEYTAKSTFLTAEVSMYGPR